MALEKELGRPSGSFDRSGGSNASFEAQYPALWGFLTWDKTPEGKPAVAGEIKVEWTMGNFLVTLLDHFQGRQTCFSLKTLDELALVVELALTAGETVWRPYQSRKRPLSPPAWRK